MLTPSLVFGDGVHEVLLGEERGLAAPVAVEDPEEGVLEVLLVLGLFLVGNVWKMMEEFKFISGENCMFFPVIYR